MFFSIKFLRFFFIRFSAIRGLLSSKIFRVWFFLELGTISFLFNLITQDHAPILKESIKIFLIQSLRGMGILVLILIQEIRSSFSLRFILWIVIILKMGTVPFHLWFLNLRNKLSWERIFLFLTLIKFLPLIILSNLKTQYSSFFRILAFIVTSLRRIYYWRIKNLIVLSSMYFTGIIILLLGFSNFWFDIIIVYILIILPVFLIFKNNNNSHFLINWFKGASRLIIFLSFINLVGLPPLPGFFLKYIWLIGVEIDFFSIVIFFLRSRIILYLYISFLLKNLLEFSKQRIIRKELIIKTSISIILVFITIFYTPIYFLI